jgi:hypothetical protein
MIEISATRRAGIRQHLSAGHGAVRSRSKESCQL